MAKRTNGSGGPAQPVRCAIYTRKSTTDGLDSAFTTLDAQREACEHYIQSQAHQGWAVLPTRYDDGGFSGGKLERPALQALRAEVEAGGIEMVVVYKFDRLSRSLSDFLRLMEQLNAKGVGFVSVTQQIDTSSSTGRLLLNMLLSFAQFEREIGSERTRDKIQAARRRGRWTGGTVVLGYRVAPGKQGLEVVPEEAHLVGLIFDLYIRTGSILTVAKRLNDQGHRQRKKRKGGHDSWERAWDKNAVLRVLRNSLYLGRVRGKDGTLYLAEHQALISQEVFDRVALNLAGRTTGTLRRSRKHEFLLTGLLRCGPCQAAMTSASTRKRDGKRYQYYRCTREQNQATRCPTGLLPLSEVEAAVVAQLRDVTHSKDLQDAILRRAAADNSEELRVAQGETRRSMAELTGEAKRLVQALGDAPHSKLLTARLADIERELGALGQREQTIKEQLRNAETARVHAEKAAALLEAFDPIWAALIPEERRELLHLLIKSITVDLAGGGLRVTLHALGWLALEARA